MPDTEEKKYLELLMWRIVQCRQAQKKYFDTRSQGALKESVRLEAKLDGAVEMLQKLGYSVAEMKKREEQAKMF